MSNDTIDAPVEISVITPVLNGVAWMQSCIENVLSQNCGSVEHIIVDGGSTDGTMAVLESYAKRYSHLRWLTDGGLGQAAAMNLGVKHARGRLIGCLNVDDYYEAGTLRLVQKLVESWPDPIFLVGNCTVRDLTGQILYVNKPSKLCLEELLLGWHVNQFPVNPSAYFYSRDLHIMIGEYDIAESHAFDLDFILRAASHVRLRYENTNFGNFRLGPGSKTWEDQQRGIAKERYYRIMEKHRRQLPIGKKFRLSASLWYGNNWDRAWKSARACQDRKQSWFLIAVVFLVRLFDPRPYYLR